MPIGAVLILAPLFTLYLAVVLASPASPPAGDSARYVWFAENLTRGHYSPPDGVDLWNGPGYPLMLAPFVAAGLPWVWAKFLNAALLLAALLYFHATLRRYITPKQALVGTYILGLWPPLVKMVPLLLSEVPSVLLVCGFAFHFSASRFVGPCSSGQSGPDGAAGRGSSRVRTMLHLALAALFLGWLALTRVLFGYVALALLVFSLMLCAWRRRPVLLKSALVAALALVVCLPYLVYTYSLTGKPFYWATSGGLSLYWMASPYKGDLGDWHAPSAVVRTPELAKNHADFFNRIGGLSPVAQDDALRKRALENLAAHPGHFLANWVANLGRLIFNWPYSYRADRPSPWLHLVPGVLLVVALALCARAGWRRRNQIPGEIWVLALFGLVAFGGSSLLSAFNRFLLPVLPVAMLWIAVVLGRSPVVPAGGPPQV